MASIRSWQKIFYFFSVMHIYFATIPTLTLCHVSWIWSRTLCLTFVYTYNIYVDTALFIILYRWQVVEGITEGEPHWPWNYWGAATLLGFPRIGWGPKGFGAKKEELGRRGESQLITRIEKNRKETKKKHILDYLGIPWAAWKGRKKYIF